MGGDLLIKGKEIRKIKWGADERRRRRLDGAEHLSIALMEQSMQPNLLKSTKEEHRPPSGASFRINESPHTLLGVKL